MKILIIGASARAAAHSALRAGLDVAALDLFVDRDLREVADCEVIRKYPDSILEQAARWPDRSILLCGGMENYPDVVSQLERRHKIIGPDTKQIRALRSLENWQSWVNQFGRDDWLRFPKIALPPADEGFLWTPDTIDLSGRWMVKSRRSIGGMKVSWLSDQGPIPHPNRYLQQWIAGPVIGITFRCMSHRTSILGIMRSLTVRDSALNQNASCEKTPFLYSGSIGPFPLGHELQIELTEWIHRVAMAIDYRGILEADFVLGEDRRLYLLEFNPRWTASMELIEMCSGINLVQAQLRDDPRPLSAANHSSSTETNSIRVLKQIVYAEKKLLISQACSDAMMELRIERPSMQSKVGTRLGWADIPAAGTPIEAGAPIATVLAMKPGAPDASRAVDHNDHSIPLERWPEVDEFIEACATYFPHDAKTQF